MTPHLHTHPGRVLNGRIGHRSPIRCSRTDQYSEKLWARSLRYNQSFHCFSIATASRWNSSFNYSPVKPLVMLRGHSN